MNLIAILSLAVFGWMTFESLRNYFPLLRTLRQAIKNPDRHRKPLPQYPKVQVLLCLRGVDPFLDRCLSGLANQDYPNYGVTIILDSWNDEARPFAEDLCRKHRAIVDLQFRDRSISTCTRKVNSLICGFEQLKDNVEVVVTCDGDAIPHNHWISDLVRPLVEEGLSATCGYRWYAPRTNELAGLVRYFWNAFAVAAMHRHAVPWAGSLAIRREVVDDPAFLFRFHRAFCDDIVMAQHLMERGARIVPQVELPVINEESITFSTFWAFLVRQMFCVRLYHPNWRPIFVSAMMLGIAVFVLAPLALRSGPTTAAIWLAGMYGYGLTQQGLCALCEWHVRRFVKLTRGHELPPYRWDRILNDFVALPALGFVYPLAVLSAAFARSQTWRGVTYQVTAGSVRVVTPDTLAPAYQRKAAG